VSATLGRILRDPRLARWALAGGLVVLVAAGAVAGAWAWHARGDAQAREALAQAADLATRALAPEAPADLRPQAQAALEAFLAAHGSRRLAVQAAYRLGDLHFAAGRPAQARAAYEQARARGAAGILSSLAALGVAYTWEAERDWHRARTAFEAVVRGLGPRDPLYEEALAGLARVQEAAGQAAAARDTYQRLLKDIPDTRRADEIRIRLARLDSAPR
jgi:tetratricopeptide (TPR) repeat protein